MSNHWLRPEVYQLFGAIGVAVCMQLIRNICTINPEVRLTKENRTAGVLENYAEGEKYAQHSLRKCVRVVGLLKSCHPLTASSHTQSRATKDQALPFN